jgi:hypothetical protein
MLANVLKSKKARQTSIVIVRAFIALKQFVLNHKDLNDKLKALENQYNQQFKDIYEAIEYLLNKDKKQITQEERKLIGFGKN